jgi:hypothetical protein
MFFPGGGRQNLHTQHLKESLSAAGAYYLSVNTELQGSAWTLETRQVLGVTLNIKVVTSPEVLSRTEFIRHSYGYPLPHRGNTTGDGRSRSKIFADH